MKNSVWCPGERSRSCFGSPTGEVLATGGGGIRILGPAPAPMERRAGRYRGQLLVQADHRARMQRFVANWRARLDQLPAGRKARWSIDIDPVELF